jgi:hypothetical protein
VDLSLGPMLEGTSVRGPIQKDREGISSENGREVLLLRVWAATPLLVLSGPCSRSVL